MKEQWQRIENYCALIREKTDFVPEIGIVLGSGLKKLAERIKPVLRIPFKDLPDFPVSEVAGHGNEYILGYLNDVPVAVMTGRVHMYEGFSATDAVLPVRLLVLLGCKKILITNAAGGIDPAMTPPSLMLITDHITSFVPSPLRGKNIRSYGERFPDMSNVYNTMLCEKIRIAAGELNIPLFEGVYLQVPGPQYETPAEIRMYASFGASAVGMSTATEALAAHHMGAKVCGISCISNAAAGLNKTTLNHKEVQEAGDKISESFIALATRAVELLHHESTKD
ncbi:MAG: purine-nucleoside phosphorylase [Clostridia bacterium]|nr:purine-nucleoside phosphorylase [Clostridia bacterium]